MSHTVRGAATDVGRPAERATGRFYVWWVLATTVSGAIAWLLCSVFAMATFGAGLLLAGLVVGLMAGAAQEWVLRRRASITPSRLGNFGWAGLTSLGAQLGLTAPLALGVLLISLVPPELSGDVVRSSLFVGIALPAGGAIFGALQAYLLRGQMWGATWWVPANAVAWGAGGLVGLVVADRLLAPLWDSPGGSPGYLQAFQVFAVGTVGTAVYAVVSGAVLVWLLGVPSRVGEMDDPEDPFTA